jgi:hypothetical protein
VSTIKAEAGAGMTSIFISYRRAGTSGYGGRLQEDLRHQFGRERVFRDIDSIPPGSDFPEFIDRAVAGSGIVLALIGSNWLTTTNKSGKRRLDETDDFVRLEIESALKQHIVVVPVLVEGATVPSPAELPRSISRLGRTQGIELSDDRWDYDLGRLVRVIENVTGLAAQPTLDRSLPGATSAHGLTALGFPAPEEAAGLSGADTTPPTPPPPLPPPPSASDRPEPAPALPHDAAPTAVGATRLRRDRRVLVAGVVSVVLLLALGVLAGVTRAGAPARRTVPGVVDRDLTFATATLRTAGFVVHTEQKPDPGRPEGIVVAQEPAGGASVKKGAAVTLSVSAGSGKQAVPSVVKLSKDDAVAAIQGAGLVADVVEQKNDGVAAGTVFQQSPDPATAVDKGSKVTITVSTGTATPSAPGSVSPGGAGATQAPGQAPAPGVGQGPATTRGTTSATAPPPTAPPPPPVSTGNLVTNPGAEGSAASAPFTVGQPPAGWQRGAFQAIAAAYGSSGDKANCGTAGYPTVDQLQGSGQLLFTGGYDAAGGCTLPGGSTPTLVQGIALTPFAGRTDGLGWEASVRLASYPGSGDGAALTVEVLGGGGQTLASATTGVVSNPAGDFAFRTKVLRGQLPPGAASVRLTLSFPSSGYSGGFADDVSFRLG